MKKGKIFQKCNASIYKWGTHAEIKFIRALPTSKLMGYAKAFELRKKWGKIRKAKVQIMLERLLK